MSQFVDSLSSDPGIAISTLGILAGCLTAVIITATVVIADAWRKVRETEETNALKQHMLEQGMTAEDIALVVSAKPGKKTVPSKRREPQLS